jgi:hypothetical protein
MGAPQELGRSCRLHGSNPGRGYRVTNPRPVVRRSAAAGGTKRAERSRGTAKRRQRSAAGRAAGGRSALIVPSKRGNATRADPVEGSEAPNHGTVVGKYDECLEIRVAYPRNSSG